MKGMEKYLVEIFGNPYAPRVKMKLRFLKILMAETFFKVILEVLGIYFGQNQKH